MAQKFTSHDEAADQLGISKDRLTQLRNANVVRGYRDGASWKFRSEDIERLATEGIPAIDPGASDLALNLDDDSLEPAASNLDLEPPHPAASPDDALIGLEGEVGGEEHEFSAGPASDLSLEEVDEPTVAGLDDEGSDDALALDDDASIDFSKDSILLSEMELGGPMGRPPSTIIGKGELDLDADLDLSPIDSGSHAALTDPKPKGGSDLLPAADDDLALDLPSPSGEFEGLEELDVDLEAESSRILSPDDVTKAKNVAKSAAASKAAGLSDLELAPTPSDPRLGASDIGLGNESASGSGITGLSALELDDDDDDQVLGEGSDVTLSGESSGINIISPSDSGLALDEVPLDLSGSAPIGSSLDLGEGEGLSFGSGVSGIGESKIGEDFQLTPLGEDEADEEKDSSQVIALDEISEEAAGMPMGLGASEEGMLVEDFGAGLTPGAMSVGTVAATETPFSLWNVLGLAGCLLLLGLSGMMTYDLLRNMWSWDGVTTLNSSLMDGLLGLFH